MSAASIRRANKAISTMFMVRNPYGFDREFESLFEMNDGTEVVREIIRQSEADPQVAQIVRDTGNGRWLEPNYLANKNQVLM